jgi:hypothetical protein
MSHLAVGWLISVPANVHDGAHIYVQMIKKELTGEMEAVKPTDFIALKIRFAMANWERDAIRSDRCIQERGILSMEDREFQAMMTGEI